MDNFDKMIHGWIDRAIDATMPRQAVVTRPEGAGVWVRFTPVDASKPEMWFPSTVAGLPAGTAGWVYPLAGGKGLFVASGIPLPKTIHARSLGIPAISTAGTVAITDASIAFTGLQPGRSYDVEWVVSMVFGPQASGTNRINPGVRVTHASGTTDEMFVNSYIDIITSRLTMSWKWGGSYVASAAGEITTVPVVTWNAGTVTVLATRSSTTVS